MKKRFLSILFAAFMCISMTGCSKNIKLNETKDIKEDQIKLTVLESKEVTIDNPALEKDGFVWEDEANGNYIKVKVTIENYGSSTYTLSGTSFYLEDEPIALLTLSQKDFIEQEIKSGASATGYLYFPVVKTSKMTYMTHMEATSSSSVKVGKYYFKLK